MESYRTKANFRTLSFVLLAMVVSLTISHVYLYYRQPSYVAVSRAETRFNVSNRFLHRFDIGFKVEGGQGLREVEEVTATRHSRLHESDAKPTRLDINKPWHLSPLRNYTNDLNPTTQQSHARPPTPLQVPLVPTSSDSRPQTTGTRASITPTTQRHFFGYLLTLKVYEQQTMAIGNLMQLQCFASKLNLSVVQPFTKDSSLTTPLDESHHQHMLRLDDIFNIEDWNQYAEREGYAPLVKWEEFIQYAPRDVVLVQMKYPLLSQVKKLHKGIHSLSERGAYTKGCTYKLAEKAMKALKRRNFRVIHRACYNFMSGDEIPLQVYQHELWGGANPTNVTVIIDQWRGIGENQRVLIKENICPGSARFRNKAHPSAKVIRDARLYVDKFLHQNDNTNYLAVIARYEMTAITRRMADKGDPNAVIPICIEETLQELTRFKRSTKLTEIFLSVDIGKYGSHSFASHRYYGHQEDMESFVRHAYNNRMNFTEWERSFETVAEKLDPGYIAKVQQAIAARAKCVLFVGGGSFQQQTLHMYHEMHPREEDRCVRVEERCTSKYRPVQ